MKYITKRTVRHYLKEEEVFKNRPEERYQAAESGQPWADYGRNISTVETKLDDRERLEGQYHIREIISNNVISGGHIVDVISNILYKIFLLCSQGST